MFDDRWSLHWLLLITTIDHLTWTATNLSYGYHWSPWWPTNHRFDHSNSRWPPFQSQMTITVTPVDHHQLSITTLTIFCHYTQTPSNHHWLSIIPSTTTIDHYSNHLHSLQSPPHITNLFTLVNTPTTTFNHFGHQLS